MAKALIIDCGAYSTATRGGSICFEDYLQFCRKHVDKVDLFISLDKIPTGVEDAVAYQQALKESAAETWKNYREMLRFLPEEKVLPVFHTYEDSKWLEKYVDFGVKYLALGGISTLRLGMGRFREWLNEQIGSYIFDSDGKARLKLHALGVTRVSALHAWDWESVDSAAWVITGGMCKIFVPSVRNGKFDYATSPYLVILTDRHPDKEEEDAYGFGLSHSTADDRAGPTVLAKGDHIFNLPTSVRKQVERYIEEHGLSLGEWEVANASPGRKLVPKEERWANKDKTKVLQIKRRGVLTDGYMRKWLNMKYFQEVNAALPVKRVYCAGSGTCPKIEREMEYRLLSFYDIQRDPSSRRIFDYHAYGIEFDSSSGRRSC